jgi:hypothetical protein
MFRDLYRSRPHLGMIYVAMKSLRRLFGTICVSLRKYVSTSATLREYVLTAILMRISS